jgi:hypothetical protein
MIFLFVPCFLFVILPFPLFDGAFFGFLPLLTIIYKTSTIPSTRCFFLFRPDKTHPAIHQRENGA